MRYPETRRFQNTPIPSNGSPFGINAVFDGFQDGLAVFLVHSITFLPKRGGVALSANPGAPSTPGSATKLWGCVTPRSSAIPTPTPSTPSPRKRSIAEVEDDDDDLFVDHPTPTPAPKRSRFNKALQAMVDGAEDNGASTSGSAHRGASPPSDDVPMDITEAVMQAEEMDNATEKVSEKRAGKRRAK